MARELVFKLKDENYNLVPVKVERKKIYGWTDLKAVDSDGNICQQVGLESSGTVIVPSGATKLGIVDENGIWMDKSELKATHLDGTEALLCPSSFELGITLDKKASIEEYLNLIVTSVYVLNGERESELAQKIGNDIYSFRFNYRSDYEDAEAFLISNGQASFIVTGKSGQFEFLSLQEQSDLNVEEEEDDLDFDDLDFGMM